MRLTVYDEKKIVAIWLTREEASDVVLQKKLHSLYADYAAQKYKIAVYHSGTDSFYECMRELVLYNRKRSAEIEVKREKKSELPPILTGHFEMPQIQC